VDRVADRCGELLAEGAGLVLVAERDLLVLVRLPQRAAARRVAAVYVLLRCAGDREREYPWALDAPDRPGHLDRQAAVALLERLAEEERPVRGQVALLGPVAVEAERLRVLADA